MTETTEALDVNQGNTCPGAAWKPEPAFNGLGGLYCLVETTSYGVDGWHWCKFKRTAPGTASIYPVKAEVPDRGEGQWKYEEVAGWHYEDPDLLVELVQVNQQALDRWDVDQQAGLEPDQKDVNRTLWPRNVRSLLEALREPWVGDWPIPGDPTERTPW